MKHILTISKFYFTSLISDGLTTSSSLQIQDDSLASSKKSDIDIFLDKSSAHAVIGDVVSVKKGMYFLEAFFLSLKLNSNMLDMIDSKYVKKQSKSI